MRYVSSPTDLQGHVAFIPLQTKKAASYDQPLDNKAGNLVGRARLERYLKKGIKSLLLIMLVMVFLWGDSRGSPASSRDPIDIAILLRL